VLIRESNRFVYLLATLPLPVTREILIGLDDGAQACPRIIVLALDPKCNTPHEIFGRLYALGVASGCSAVYLLRGEGERQQKGFLLGAEQSTY
jgi:hypothetical protein